MSNSNRSRRRRAPAAKPESDGAGTVIHKSTLPAESPGWLPYSLTPGMREGFGHKGMRWPPAEADPPLPDLTKNAARLRAAQAQQRELDSRENEPQVIRAAGPQSCPRCIRKILKDDLIATWPDGEGWVHMCCAVCQGCGEWKRSAGAHGKCT